MYNIDVGKESTALVCQNLQSCRVAYILQTELDLVLSRELHTEVTIPGCHDFYADFSRTPNCFD